MKILTTRYVVTTVAALGMAVAALPMAAQSSGCPRPGMNRMQGMGRMQGIGTMHRMGAMRGFGRMHGMGAMNRMGRMQGKGCSMQDSARQHAPKAGTHEHNHKQPELDNG